MDDAVSVVESRAGASRFRELEVEATPQAPRELIEAVVARLRNAGAGAPDPTPKYLRAIGGPDAAPPWLAASDLSRSSSLGDVVTRAIVDGVTRMIRHDPVIRLDSDPEGVHQARVLPRQVSSFGDAPTDDELHRIRILAKRRRYAAEASAPVLGKKTAQLARATAGLQDTLGELHDGVVAEAWLREWAEREASGLGGFAAGELAALEQASAGRAPPRWPDGWKRVMAVAPE